MNLKALPIHCLVIFLLTFVGKIKSQLKRISAEENERIQKFCRNPDFTNGVKIRGMVIGGGRPLQPGEYPWAVALSMSSALGTQTFCGGTLISQRHVLTARHCMEAIREVEKQYQINWWLEVGGVCAQVDLADGCRKKDMFDVPYSRAIYPKASMAIEKRGKRGKPRSREIARRETDFAIVELAEDLNVVPLKAEQKRQMGNKNNAKVQIACLPHFEMLSERMNVYGWGNTERNMDRTNSQDEEERKMDESNPSAHLLEIKMALLGKRAIEADAERKKKCDSDKLICLQSPELVHTKDGAKGDSGTGIVGTRKADGLAYVEAITIAGIPNQLINIGLTTSSIAREICFYTGVCVERFWIENGKSFEILTNDGNEPMVMMDQQILAKR
ncbi:hypothetical protein niasHT_013509 [Heterodera trifolii]|uniref:Peptidase S1 domain-containing protein n=1 Tax=Heterodera trifolii TaxID=157864 RepID=A0ABD2LD26_9BILA